MNAILFMLAGFIHTMGHAFGTIPTLASVAKATDLDGLLLTNPFTEPPTRLGLWFASIPGLTGVLLWLFFAAMAFTSLPAVRAKKFDVFW